MLVLLFSLHLRKLQVFFEGLRIGLLTEPPLTFYSLRGSSWKFYLAFKCRVLF